MARNHNKCPHLENIVQLSLPELCKIKQGHFCSECDTCGPNLWICLQRNCLHIGCSEQANDHSTEHFKSNQQHCIHMNLSSQRIWCYLCETEVFFTQKQHRRNSFASACSNSNFNMIDSTDPSRFFERMYDYRYGGGGTGESPESSYDEDDGDRRQVEGLVGLQNIANTCYMNAALQALSNSPPLLSYFLQCGDIIEATSELSGNQRKPGLAKSYHRLVKTMWCRNKRNNGYVVPRDILTRIRNVHPMFRGFQQHDTQEFLRCFMDQLHEELKEITPPPPEYVYKQRNSSTMEPMTIENDDDQSLCSTPSPSQSEAEYETCDSGVSERSSLSDELQMSTKRNDHLPTPSPHSTSPNFCQRTSIASSSTKSMPYSTCSTAGSSNTTASMGGISQQAHQQQPREKSPPKRPHRSIISDVFDGKLLSSVQCLTCNRISTREETFQDLSLPIPGKDHLAVLHQSPGLVVSMSQPQSGVTCTDVVYQAGQDGWLWWIWNWLRSWFWGPAVSLHDCMAAFFSADELKGDNMYSCEKCHKLRNGIKYSRVLELPEMLCVHLKRFRHDLSYSSKISSPVHFPLIGLDMRPYLHKDCKSEVSTYDLTAVICHHGTVGGGHYTSFARHELSGKWFEFDDQLVTEVTPEIVQNCQAYVLFYRKSNPKMDIIRARAKELGDSNPPQSSDLQFYVSRQWINRFYNFAEPGPIDNYTILCPHGGLPPCKAALSNHLVVPVNQALWDYLYKYFGGGPICNRLFECDTCRKDAELLARRQETELEAFTRLKGEFQNETTPTTIYAISMAWFRQWQVFAEGKVNEDPGPINNTPIIITTTTTSETGIATTTTTVRPGSDYAQLNKKLWKFFHNIYNGGPEIILRGGPPDEDDHDDEYEAFLAQQSHKEKEIEIMEIDTDQPNPDEISLKNQNIDEYFKNIDLIDNVHDSGGNVIMTSTSSNHSGGIGSNQLKTSKNVSFEDEIIEDTNKTYYCPRKEYRRHQYNSLRLSKEGNDLLNKFYEKLELKESFGLEGKYQTQNQVHQPIENHYIPSEPLKAITTTTTMNSTTSSSPQLAITQKTSFITTTSNNYHDINTHNNNTMTNSTLTTISSTSEVSTPLVDPRSDSSNSNSTYPKIIQNPQVTTTTSTIPSSKLHHQSHHHHHHHSIQQQPQSSQQQQQQQQRETAKIMSSSKRKIGEVTPLINYQPFQASATTNKVELKSYRKMDGIQTLPQHLQLQQMSSFQNLNQNQNHQISTSSSTTDLKGILATTAEIHHLNAENKSKSSSSLKSPTFRNETARERRKNMNRKSNRVSSMKTSSLSLSSIATATTRATLGLPATGVAASSTYSSDPNNSDSG